MRALRLGAGAALLGGLTIFLFAAPYVVFTTGYSLDVATLAMYFAILSATWSLLAGIAGQFSFAHVALGGLAAYAGAVWAREYGGTTLAPAGIWPTLAVGTGFALALGVLLGLLLQRLHGAYLALFTIAFAEVARLVIIGESQITGGDLSLPVVPLPGVPSDHYYVMLVALLAVLLITYGLLRSRVGLYLRAMREDHVAASAMGVRTGALRVFVFALTALLVGACGSLYFHTTARLVPSNLDLLLMSQVIAFAVIGGLESPLAAAIGGFGLSILLQNLDRITLGTATTAGIAAGLLVLAAAATAWQLARKRFEPRPAIAAVISGGLAIALLVAGSVDIELGIWRYAAFGGILVLVLRLAPNGLLTPLFGLFSDRAGARAETVRARAVPQPPLSSDAGRSES